MPEVNTGTGEDENAPRSDYSGEWKGYTSQSSITPGVVKDIASQDQRRF